MKTSNKEKLCKAEYGVTSLGYTVMVTCNRKLHHLDDHLALLKNKAGRLIWNNDTT